jgi:hypothetical protein
MPESNRSFRITVVQDENKNSARGTNNSLLMAFAARKYLQIPYSPGTAFATIAREEGTGLHGSGEQVE